jgi:hypothetical protein
MQRIEPSESQEKKPTGSKPVLQLFLIAGENNESAQDEEKVDEKPSISQKR